MMMVGSCLTPTTLNAFCRILVTDDFVLTTSHDKTARIWYNDTEDHEAKPCIRTLRVSRYAELKESPLFTYVSEKDNPAKWT